MKKTENKKVVIEIIPVGTKGSAKRRTPPKACSVCGEIKAFTVYGMCEPCQKETDPILFFYRKKKRDAADRKIKFLLSVDEFETLIRGDCYYCAGKGGEAVKFLNSNKSTSISANGGSMHSQFNGIDRIDSHGVYEAENCVTACVKCNIMKSWMTQKSFIRQCKKIYINQKKDRANKDGE